MTINLSPEFISKIKKAVERFDTEANESTRTHKLISRLLNEVVDLTDYSIDYTAEPFDDSGRRPDFVMHHDERDFFIIEAKASLSEKGHKDQIRDYLDKAGLEHGCLTDGISWTMLRYDQDSKRLERVKNLIVLNPQQIVDYILSHL